jgi:MFS family permease
LLDMKRRIRRPQFYGWYIVGAGALSNLVVLGTVIIGFGAFVRPLREEMAWSGAAIGLGFSLRSLEQGLLSPFTGLIVDRIGARRMALIGNVIIVAGVLLFSQAHAVPVYLVASVLISLGLSLGTGTAYPAAVMHWFQAKRGRAMGLLYTGNAAGWFLPPAIVLLMSAVGWRSTAVISALVILVIGIPTALVIRDRPEPYGEHPDGEAPPAATAGSVPGERADASPRAPNAATGMGVRDALRTPALYLLALASAASAVALTAWTIFQFDHLQNAGFSAVEVGVVVSLYGAVQVSLRYLVGWIGDVVGRRRLFVASYLAQGVGLLAFTHLSPDLLWLIPVYFVLFGFGHATWIVLQMPTIADYYGARRFGTIRGLITSLQMPATLAAPWVAGTTLDRTGGYELILTIYAIAAASGALWVLLIRRPTWPELEARAAVAAGAAPVATAPPATT